MEQNDAPAETLAFDPVPVRRRVDGWTPERQRDFIRALSDCRVLEACRRIGLSSESAYRLYRRPDAASFRRAWDAAVAGPRPPRRPSTSGLRRETHGMCQMRQDHQLPDPAIRPGPVPPTYSLEAFRRLTRAAKRSKFLA